jgi:CBS domain-containing protein
MLVREIMTTEVVTVRPDSTLKEAMCALDAHRVTALPVVDGVGRLVGVLSEADVLRDVVAHDRRATEIPLALTGEPARLRVTDAMTHLPMSVAPDDDVARAVEFLVDTQVKSLPVVERDRVVGMVSRSDVIAVLARQDMLIEAEVDELLRSAGVECVATVSDGVVRLESSERPEDLRIARVIAGSVPGVIGVAGTEQSRS